MTHQPATMTSTSFNVGLGDGDRVSSRVLRPPGGGHTDIFGGEPEPPRTTGRRMVPGATAAGGQFEYDGGRAQPAAAQNGDGHQNGASAEPKAEPKPETPKEEAKPAPAPQAPQAEAPKRVRVPPGGFSSGLW
ncbi:hypothetical protein JYU34_004880 [Plutella xylostella]|uniref:Microtubule-associated protein Jupiter n=3 Tax=Plutella xylostella TaxID=51655 RepID=A0ABQ7QVD5_PLUXY|nr:hypothetical protein JYU34_004880 [Plutella xylostella]